VLLSSCFGRRAYLIYFGLQSLHNIIYCTAKLRAKLWRSIRAPQTQNAVLARSLGPRNARTKLGPLSLISSVVLDPLRWNISSPSVSSSVISQLFYRVILVRYRSSNPSLKTVIHILYGSTVVQSRFYGRNPP
jgi:hypothetical protein